MKNNYFKAHGQMGVLLLKTGYESGAIDSFEKAIKINSKYAFAYYHLGHL